MKKSKSFLSIAIILSFSISYGNSDANMPDPNGSVPFQTTSKSAQTKPKTGQKTQTKPKSPQTGAKPPQAKPKTVQTHPKTSKTTTKPAVNTKPKETGVLVIGNQRWAVANLDVSKFRNGDSILQAKTNEEWVKAGNTGKPAWCYYNNDPLIGKKYGKLYNWYAVNDPRELAPAGWSLPGDEDWVMLTNYLGGPGMAGTKLKSTTGWIEDYNGTNESGFAGLPGGYRVENGKFMNLGSIATWWSTTESRPDIAIDHYLAQSGNFPRSNNSKLRGEYVRCIKK